MTRNEYMSTIARAEKKAEMLGTFYTNVSDTWGINGDKMARIIARNIERFMDEIMPTLSEDDSFAITHEYLFAYLWDLNH